jgi:tetratricopeptide (TPR) repeat protein
MSLADVAGSELTRQAVHLYETGRVRPSLRALRIVARRVGLPLQSLVSELHDGQQHPDPRVDELCRLANTQSWVEAVELARQVLAEDVDDEVAAFANFYLGQALCQLSTPDQGPRAAQHLRAARRHFERIDDRWLRAEAMEWEAFALYLQEDPGAAHLAREALAEYRSLEPRDVRIEARMLEHVGTLLLREREYEASRRHYEHALLMAGGVLDLVRLARLYHGLARCCCAAGEQMRAVGLAHTAVSLYESESQRRPDEAQIPLARAESDLGRLLVLDGRLDQAEALFDRALGRFDAAGCERQRSHVLLGLAELRRVQGRVEEAVELIETAIADAQRLKEVMAQADGHQQLAMLHSDLGNEGRMNASFHRALEILDRHGLTARRSACVRAWFDASSRQFGAECPPPHIGGNGGGRDPRVGRHRI